MRRVILWAALLVLTPAGCSHNTQTHPNDSNAEKPGVASQGHADGGAGVVEPGAAQTAVDPTAVTPPKPPDKVKIFVRTVPAKVPGKVWVSWGKKKLGFVPLTIERPRDSGPVDLILRAKDYFPVHARAYTVKNDVLSVKLTKLTDKMTLFGAKQEIPEPDAIDPLSPATAGNATPPATPGSRSTPPAARPRWPRWCPCRRRVARCRPRRRRGSSRCSSRSRRTRARA